MIKPDAGSREARKNDNKIKIEGKRPWEVSQGPQAHRRGGVHQDRRNRRIANRLRREMDSHQ